MHDEIPLWREDPDSEEDKPLINDQLDEQLQNLLDHFQDVLSNEPGKTIANHNIETGNANQVRYITSCIPRNCKDLQDMEGNGIIEPSSSGQLQLFWLRRWHSTLLR